MTKTPDKDPSPGRAAGEELSARTLAGLGSVNPDEWDRLVPKTSSALSFGYLSAFEKAQMDGLSSRPIVVSADDGGRFVAACPGYWYDLDLVSTRLPAAAPVMAVLHRAWPRLLKARTLELGTPAPLNNPFLVSGDVSRERAVAAISKEATLQAKKGRAGFVLVQNLASPKAAAVEQFTSLGFVLIPLLPTVVVSLDFGSFDEYLGAMRSQYRRRARQAMKRSGDVTVEHLSDFSSLAEELSGLWHKIYDRAKELRREVLTPAYFEAMSALESSSVLLLRRSDGSIASFALLLEDRPWLSFLQCGFEERAGKEEGAYFRLLYELVRFGIEGGYDQLDLGMTTVEPKLDVGGVPVPLYGLIRHSNPLIHKLMAKLATGPLGPKPVEARKVFKEPPPSAAEIVSRRQLAS